MIQMIWFRKKFVKCSICSKMLRKVSEGDRFVCWRCTDRVVAAEDLVKIERLPYPEKDPFSLTPSDYSMIIDEVRKGEVETLERALLDGKLVLVTGELGSGKSTLCERVYNRLRLSFKMGNSGVIPVFLRATTFTRMQDYIEVIMKELKLPIQTEKLELIEILVNWPKFHSEKLAFIIDDIVEAGFWSEVGEFIRVISDIPGMSVAINGTERDMQRFMGVNPALYDRVQVKIGMRPLTEHEIRSMLVTRAKVLGELERRLISEDAYREISRRCKGNPRKALKIASNAYQLAIQFNSPTDRILVGQIKHS